VQQGTTLTQRELKRQLTQHLIAKDRHVEGARKEQERSKKIATMFVSIVLWRVCCDLTVGLHVLGYYCHLTEIVEANKL
jgi:hypothetical protein